MVYEVSGEILNSMMIAAESWQSEGFGRSGETYIVGEDFLMRTNSRFAVENLDGFLSHLKSLEVDNSTLKKIRHSGSTVLTLPVTSIAAKEALLGGTGTKILRDYRNVQVLSSYTQIQIPGVKWVLLSEIDLSEALSSIIVLRSNLTLYTAILALVFLFIGSILSRAIASPLNRLARQALAMSEDLQRRIGHDLHDDLAQKLVGISLLAKASANDIRQSDSLSAADIDRLAKLADGAVQTARQLARGLSPVPVLRDGLCAALAQLASEMEASSAGVKIIAQVANSLPEMGEEKSLHLYRIAQQAISNAIKHGQPHEIVILASCEKEMFSLSVSNDGTPFSARDNDKGMGLAIMAMRSRTLGASFAIDVRPDGWTEVRCKFRILKR